MVAASFVSGGLNLGVCTVVIKALMKLFGGGHSGDEDKKSVSVAPAASDSGKSNLRPVTLKDLEGFVDYVVRALVDNPDEVKVVTETDGEVKVIKISCRKEDTGKIIGKKGKTIIALRALVAGAAGRMQDRVSVEVMD